MVPSEHTLLSHNVIRCHNVYICQNKYVITSYFYMATHIEQRLIDMWFSTIIGLSPFGDAGYKVIPLGSVLYLYYITHLYCIVHMYYIL